MNGSALPLKPNRVHQIAAEICELFQQEIDALQHGLAEVDMEPYLERRARIYELRAELKALHQGSS